jgi:hypothetical protein
MLQVLVDISLKDLLQQREHGAMQKFEKKEKRKKDVWSI